MSKQPEYPVLIPYRDLCELLEASRQVQELQKEIRQYKGEVLALRVIQQQCMELIRDLQKQI